ncbi:MAG: type I restriction enzyme HsdR N-terminal domain-containing protein [Flavobacteriaceae bacterium]|nr:type I restriction enzyme HsdR N-terminal domain-containing protein [Flavobacteriaceae bacterium]
MIKLNFHNFKFNFKNKDNKPHIFDILRKKLILLTPEEWVRQHVIIFLISQNIPKNHIAVEKKIIINKMTKRFDLVVHDRNGNILLLVECKSPNVKIDQKVFDQTSIYNQYLKSKFLMITNGLNHFYFKVDDKAKTYKFVKNFPLK